ncbi:hypothetical protein JCM18899A_32370 [Nocardioides sp. AN3]
MSGSSATSPGATGATQGRRFALIVAVTDYLDTSLRRLRAPAGDAAELRDLLADPEIGGFAVTSVVNERAHQLRIAIEDFLADRHTDDLLLVYLSCHGLVDARRRLFFAARDTLKDRLASSGIESHWLLEQLEDCRARRQVVILDCCFSGAFARGAKGDDDLALGERLVGDGRGRVVLTASRGTEYSFEGEPIGDDDARGSVFTSALIEGVRTGRADTDADGEISVEDAYAYAFEQVRRAGSAQTPQRWLYGAEGSIRLAHVPPSAAVTERPQVEPAAEPPMEPAAEPPAEPPAKAGGALPGQPAAETGPRPASTTADSAAAPPPPTIPPTRGGASRRTLGIAAAAVGAAVVAAAVVVLLTQGGGDSGSAGSHGSHSTAAKTGTFAQQSPWRLRIKDDISGVSGVDDNGCDVTLTDDKTGNIVREWDSFYGVETFQMRRSGTFRWQVNDPGCLLFPQKGDGGMTALPFVWTGNEGDTPVFQSPGRVTAMIGDRHGSSTCDLYLISAVDGRALDFRTAEADMTSVPLESDGPARVFIAAPSCAIQVSPAP